MDLFSDQFEAQPTAKEVNILDRSISKQASLAETTTVKKANFGDADQDVQNLLNRINAETVMREPGSGKKPVSGFLPPETLPEKIVRGSSNAIQTMPMMAHGLAATGAALTEKVVGEWPSTNVV